MTALDAFRRFQEIRQTGQFERITEVIDVENYVENCVGLTGWTIGFDTALANFEHGVRATFSDMNPREQDVVDDGRTLIVRLRTEATHSGKPFMGIPASGSRVSYDVIDMYRVGEDGPARPAGTDALLVPRGGGHSSSRERLGYDPPTRMELRCGDDAGRLELRSLENLYAQAGRLTESGLGRPLGRACQAGLRPHAWKNKA